MGHFAVRCDEHRNLHRVCTTTLWMTTKSLEEQKKSVVLSNSWFRSRDFRVTYEYEPCTLPLRQVAVSDVDHDSYINCNAVRRSVELP